MSEYTPMLGEGEHQIDPKQMCDQVDIVSAVLHTQLGLLPVLILTFGNTLFGPQQQVIYSGSDAGMRNLVREIQKGTNFVIRRTRELNEERKRNAKAQSDDSSNGEE